MMLTGDNGILNRAGETKNRNDEAQIQERVRLSYLAALTRGKGNYTKESLEEELENEFGENNYIVDDSGDKNWVITVQGQTVKIPAGIINEKVPVKEITATSYGERVDYIAPNGYDNWKVFYKDTSNIYIITGDYVPVNKINIDEMAQGMTIKSAGEYCLWGEFGEDYHFISDGVAQLTNTANWSNFANGTSGGKQISGATATGGPTLEMWIASWNAKGSENGYSQLYSKKVIKQKNDTNEKNQDDYEAYYVGTSENPSSYDADVSSKDSNNNPIKGYADILYFPHTEDYSGCKGYWLTSCSARGVGNGIPVDYRGKLDYTSFNSTNYGVRPVVCLPSDITATWNEEKLVWNIIKK